MVTEDTLEAEVREGPRLFKRLAWYRRRVESLEEQAVIDDLTGLRNQRALWRELSRRAQTCSESSPLAVVMLDFDLFHEINEGYGHAVGDAVLERAASVLRAAAPSPRLAFRYGGEEFVMLVPGDEADGRELAERVRAAIARENGHLPAITVSCGVAELDSPVEPWVALDRADAALRDAKRAGRNRVAVASTLGSSASVYVVEELEHETARRAALALAVATLEVRDRSTADHSDDVLTLCESLGRELGFEGRALERLMAGAQLHDVGKVAVPSEILNKPGPLNDDEWSLIHEHTVIGERILRSVPEMAEVATIVRHSHEHWDGSGYPDGLQGEDIPLASRVILCADAFHAIRSDRPYRAGRPAAEALDEVRGSAGTQFDPAVVAALLRVADDVRGRGSRAMALPRKKRLIVLLATLAISGTAVAGVSKDVRDAIGSIFATGSGEVAPAPGGFDFGFGPLGDLLSIAPVAGDRASGERAVVPRAVATRDERLALGTGSGPGGLESLGTRGGSRAAPRDAVRPPARGGHDTTTPRSGPKAPNTAPLGGSSPGTGGTKPTGGANSPTGGANSPTSGGSPPAVDESAPGSPDTTTGDVPMNGVPGTDKNTGRGLGQTLPTPRNPEVPPGQNGNADTPGRPQDPGRPDPPAIGKNTGPPDKG